MRCRPWIAAALALLAPLCFQPSAHAQGLQGAGLEVGARYWYSMGRNAYDYYGDTTQSALISRLAYGGMAAHSGEVFFRGDTLSGFFLKGTIGVGVINAGQMTDEDFPPLTSPYSRTTSMLSGDLSFGSIDVGYALVRQPAARIGAFVGYGRWNENANAAGCTQLATSTVCQPSVPASVVLVKETDAWNLLRLGLSGDFLFGERWKFSADAAYVIASQNALDQHFYTFGSDPASGHGSGYQVEALLNYQMTEKFSVGLGGRWWHLGTKAVDSFDQLLTYQTDRYGVFAQASLRLN